MFNNRMLAVAAVLALAIPALGAAAPIVAPPQPEQLVEGHTVFTVIEIIRNETTNATRFAAAVAVLVREYADQNANLRFPGVLWFNDQYLVNPTANNVANAAYRYPCGGAVMAVNAGDADPRVSLASPGVTQGSVYAPGTATAGEDDSWVDTTTGTADPDSGTVDQAPANSDALVSGLGADTGFEGGYDLDDDSVDDVTIPDVWDYQESYLITDPNDHVWVIDLYHQYSEIGLGGTRTAYTTNVWVVNILGSPVFIPDDGVLSCGPYNDLLSTLYYQYSPSNGNVATAAGSADDAIGQGWDATIGSQLPYEDTPPAGWRDGRNGYCYEGGGLCATRMYNALLYFQLEDLDPADMGAARDHSLASTDTNGCHDTVGGEWACPAGDDAAEGNSHPFHPAATDNATSPLHVDAEVCPPGFAGTNPSNHGGSTDPYGACDYAHRTQNIDIYFSPNGRPMAPLFRNFAEMDTQGSTAPFQDYHCAYEAATCSPAYPGYDGAGVLGY